MLGCLLMMLVPGFCFVVVDVAVGGVGVVVVVGLLLLLSVCWLVVSSGWLFVGGCWSCCG